MWAKEFQNKFGSWIKKFKNVKNVCCLVGTRMDESLNNWRAIQSDKRIEMFNSIPWTKKITPTTYNAYPIYDWKTKDIWICNFRNIYPYNKIYDLYYYAGIPAEKMRVGSPFNNHATQSLHYYRAIDPIMWGKMVSRVNGVNFAANYGNSFMVAYKEVRKPEKFKEFTWKKYLDYLLTTLPTEISENYQKKFKTSVDFWLQKGGALDDKTIEEILKHGCKIRYGKSPYSTTKKAVIFEKYPDDLPNVTDFKSVPSYKRMVICILKNDHKCTYMGFSETKKEKEKAFELMQKYANL